MYVNMYIYTCGLKAAFLIKCIRISASCLLFVAVILLLLLHLFAYIQFYTKRNKEQQWEKKRNDYKIIPQYFRIKN